MKFFSKEFITVYLVLFTEILGWSLILPFLPFLATDLGASPFIIGAIISSFSLFQFISAPIIGKLSDRFGRKPLLIISQVSTFIGFLLLGFANSVWMLFLSRLVDGLLGSNMTLGRAYIVDITKEGKERSKAFNYVGIVMGIGLFIGPALGGILGAINYSIPAFIAAIIVLISIIFTSLFLKETVTRRKEIIMKVNDFIPLKDFIKGFTKKKLKNVFWEYLFFHLSFVILISSLALLIDAQLGFGPEDVGILLLIVGITRALFQLIAFPKLIDKFASTVLLFSGFLINTIACFALFIMNSRIGLYLIVFFFSIGTGLVRPMIESRLGDKVDEKKRGKYMGVIDSIGSINQIIGPVIGGFIISNFFSGYLGIFAGFLMFISLFLELNYLIEYRKNNGLKL